MILNSQNLKKKYLQENLTHKQLSSLFNTSPRTIQRRLLEYGIKRKLLFPELRNKKWLYNKYIIGKLSTIKIGNELGCEPGTVHSWLEKHKIKVRDRGHTWRGKKLPEETKKKLSIAKKGKFVGHKNPNWKGGQISESARERNSALSRKWSFLVRQRDNFKCQKKGCNKKIGLHAHHIKSYTKFPELRHELSNGITLCAKHHEQLHPFDFPLWIKNKQKKLKKQTVTVKKSFVKFKPPIAKLKKLYIDQKLSCKKISVIFKVNEETVRRKIHELNIKTRGPAPIPTVIIDKEVLSKMYQEMSMAKIAKHFNCGQTVIHKLIHRYKIKLKNDLGRGHASKKGRIFSDQHKLNLSKSLKEKFVGSKNHNWKGGPVIKKCLLCKKDFVVLRARINTAKYCSYSCNSKSKFLY